MLTFKEIENALIEAFTKITDLNPSKGEIRVSYQDMTQPSWKHSDTVLSFHLSPVANLYSEDVDVTFKGSEHTLLKMENKFTSVLDCSISVFGPICRETAERVRVLIQHELFRAPLTKKRIYPVLKTPSPRYVPYEYNKQWWQRADITLTLNVENVIEIDNVPAIESVQIGIITDTGERRDVITD